MSSNAHVPLTTTPVPLPRTAVPLGITDPVQRARAELKAALAAIEEKSNVPKRMSAATDRTRVEAKSFARRNPAAAAAIVVAGAASVGLVVWSVVRAYSR